MRPPATRIRINTIVVSALIAAIAIGASVVKQSFIHKGQILQDVIDGNRQQVKAFNGILQTLTRLDVAAGEDRKMALQSALLADLDQIGEVHPHDAVAGLGGLGWPMIDVEDEQRTLANLRSAQETLRGFYASVRHAIADDRGGKDARMGQLVAQGLSGPLEEFLAVQSEFLRLKHDVSERMATVEHAMLIAAVITVMANAVFILGPLTSISADQARRLREVEEERNILANLDPISGLPNQSALDDFLSRYPADKALLVLMLDIRPASALNRESAGAVSLGIVTAISGRLRKLGLQTVLKAHCGNDRFALIYDNSDGRFDRHAEYGRLAGLTEQPLELRDHNIRLVLSVGSAVRKPNRSARLTLENAGIALDQAIAQGGGLTPYAPVLKRRHLDGRNLIRDLKDGLDRNEIVAFFQPQVCLRSRRVLGFEALVRWHHPSRGLLSPGQFLDQAQQAGLDEPIGDLMLTQALEALIAWGRAGHFVNDVSVNMSRSCLQNPTLVDRIKWDLDRLDLPPERLRIEVLENIYIDSDEDRLVRVMRDVARAGIQIDMDDFGTGSTSITGLRRLAINRVKIDRSFVRDIDTNPANRDLVKTMIGMANGLGIEVLAEGVETEQELAVIDRMGCKLVQGYHFAKPMPLTQTIAWLDARAEPQPADARDAPDGSAIEHRA